MSESPGTTRFDGRTAIVTGAGGGLGRAYALELARRGARVVINDIAGADAVVAQIAALGGVAIASHDSVATRAGGRATVDRALDAFGRLDILIGNAGNLRHARFDEMSEADIDSVIDVHLKGGFHLGQPAFAAMKRQGYGRILFTAARMRERRTASFPPAAGAMPAWRSARRKAGPPPRCRARKTSRPTGSRSAMPALSSNP